MTEGRPRITARRSGHGAVCPLCRCDLAAEAIPTEACPGCGTSYHQDCARELGGCSTAGCPRKGEVPVDPARARALEQRRALLAEQHEARLLRFRAGRDALARARWWTNVGMPLRAVALLAFLFAAWQLRAAAHGDWPERLGLAVGAALLALLLVRAAERLDGH